MSKPLAELNTQYATFYMVKADQKDLYGKDIQAKVRNHKTHGKVKIFSGYFYGQFEWRWSLDMDMDQSAPKQEILSHFGVDNA